jgi:hypothetical protein
LAETTPPIPTEVGVPPNGLKAFLVRKQVSFFIGLALVYACAFTGEWRVGRDSALYRGLGHSLAMGKGFSFSLFGQRQIYPGLPLLLAGLEKVFGDTPVPALILMHAMALGCLITTYKLISLRFPQWMAVAVTFCVGINGWFLELTNEILTDIPFLFGLLLALYGWERLRAGTEELPDSPESESFRRPRRRRISIVILLLGLAIAALVRPTFWILAVAWVLVCAWGIIVGPRRRFYAICLGVLLAVWIVALMLDPRVKGFNPLGGGYEKDALNAFESEHFIPAIVKQSVGLVRKEFAYSFFGQQWVPGVTELFTLTTFAASLLLWRKNPLWTILIAATLGATVMMTTVPRYYVMVLPLTVLSWLMLFQQLGRLLPPKHRELALLAGLLMLAIPNFVRCCKVIGEQHHLDPGSRDEGTKWKDVRDMGELVRNEVPPGGKVIGPAATIMSYVSDRTVLLQRELFPPKLPIEKIPAYLAKSGIGYAVFPPTEYKKGERLIRDLMEHGVIVPVERVGRTKDMVLAKIVIQVPAGDWRDAPEVDVMTARGIRTAATANKPAMSKAKKRKPTTAQVARMERLKKQAKLAKAQKHQQDIAKAKAQAAAIAKKRKKKRAQGATTQPVTLPATAPITPPITAPSPPAPQSSAGPASTISVSCTSLDLPSYGSRPYGPIRWPAARISRAARRSTRGIGFSSSVDCRFRPWSSRIRRLT